MLVKPAPFIRFPHSLNRRDSFYRVDQDRIDPILVRQKDQLYGMYNNMTNKDNDLRYRHRVRQDALFLLEFLLPLWKLFDYEYKYHELFRMFDEYTIV